MYHEQAHVNPAQDKIIDEPYYSDNPDKQPRNYQMNAINKTVEAIANDENRILLVMATGTGKTYTAFQIIWRLWKAGKGWIPCGSMRIGILLNCLNAGENW